MSTTTPTTDQPDAAKRVTATAAQTDKPAACAKCGATEPREDLWAIDEYGVTTHDLFWLHHWICKECFTTPPQP
jgi:hypothetical protein